MQGTGWGELKIAGEAGTGGEAPFLGGK